MLITHLLSKGRRQLSLHIRQICLGSARSQQNQGFGNCPSINDRNVTLRNLSPYLLPMGPHSFLCCFSGPLFFYRQARRVVWELSLH